MKTGSLSSYAFFLLVEENQGVAAELAQRITDAARKCCHVFQPMELVNIYVRGLHEATRERIQEQVRRLPLKKRADLATVRQIAAAEGRAQRALLRPRSVRPGAVRASGVRPLTRAPTFFMEPQVDSAPAQYPSPPTTPTTSKSFYDPVPTAHEVFPPDTLRETPKSPPGDPVSIVEAAVGLDSIFLVGEPTKETLDGYNLEGRNILRPTEEIPDLTDEQVGQAMAVIPADYWQLNCWSCRSLGHSTFTCPKLTVKQRIYFAYCYYLHQLRANPIQKEWFTQKRNALQGKGPEPGPRPSQGRGDSRAHKSAHSYAQ